jgi:phosphoribosylanthranilate isomerase
MKQKEDTKTIDMFENPVKRYRGVVVFRYYQTIEVEAENEEQAARLMFDQYDDSRADGESDVLDVEEIK